MSLDIWCRLGSLSSESLNVTHNVHMQIAAGGADPWEYEGRSVEETIPELQKCLAYLSDPRNVDALRKLDPENGWGDLDGSRNFVRKLLDLAMDHPDCKWVVSR